MLVSPQEFQIDVGEITERMYHGTGRAGGVGHGSQSMLTSFSSDRRMVKISAREAGTEGQPRKWE